jgi:hypothetical protein
MPTVEGRFHATKSTGYRIDTTVSKPSKHFQIWKYSRVYTLATAVSSYNPYTTAIASNR